MKGGEVSGGSMRKFSVGDCGFGQCVYLATMEVRILPPQPNRDWETEIDRDGETERQRQGDRDRDGETGRQRWGEVKKQS